MPADTAAPTGAAPRPEGPYRQYFEEMPCYLSVHDRKFRIIDGNRRFREDFGGRLGEPCYEVYKGLDGMCPDCPVEATFADGESHSSEQSLINKRGQKVPVMVNTTPVRDETGKVVAVMEMHTDLTEVKRLEGLLEHSQERLAQLFEEVPCYVTVQGPDLVVRHANRKFRRTFGSAVGNHCYRVYKHRDEQCLVCPTLLTLADGKVRHHEEVVFSADGERINVLCTTAPVHDAEGHVEGAIEMSVDITELRQLQPQLASIGLLVGSISHGIKGLLSGLDGGIYLVNTGLQKDRPERVKKGWDMVQRNVTAIRSMVLDILYYAKDRELILSEVSVEEMVSELEGVIGKKASDQDIELQLKVEPGAGTLQGDYKAIRSTLVNLLENSLEACRGDRQKDGHRVSLKAWRTPPWMVFEIEDNGIGMDRETKEKIFSLFFSSKGIKGTGLGLFIANKIVDRHGGTIEVESEPGRGTRFLVRLPLQARPSTRPPEVEVTPGEQTSEPGAGSGTPKVRVEP
jgi:PAS domain S-box-containing protein